MEALIEDPPVSGTRLKRVENLNLNKVSSFLYKERLEWELIYVGLGRYHLYVSYACPWAHRTLITRVLKGLEGYIGLTVVSPHMGDHGWPFANADAFPGAEVDPFMNAEHIKDIYLAVQPDYDGR